MRRRWSKKQRRYREILIEIRSHLNRAGAYRVIRLLRRTAPEFFTRDAIVKTRDDARLIKKAAVRLTDLAAQATLSPELRLRLAPEEERLRTVIRAVCKICDEADRDQRDDQVKIWCAEIAFTLLVRFSDKPPTSGSARSPFRVIASLLYEIVTGEAGHDLRRACADELDKMRILRPPG
ncbi:hypothetical protein [Bradyrhizobium oligotrophicum]|uniref:hypothetical protein n=1 Tax=Bradyrhizobium oligotrophicum TaxID=44255 RepID=UPI003EC0C134